jgi:hypothetical protein
MGVPQEHERRVESVFSHVSAGMTIDEVSNTLNNLGKTIRTDGNKVTRWYTFSHYELCNRQIQVVFINGKAVEKSIYAGSDNCLDIRRL